MAKQLNVDLRFTADTSQAKRAIQDLQNSLSTIAKMPGNASNLFDDTEIKKASKAALELQGHLQKAVNVNTGKLDLSRFASSLKTSNKDLSIYANTLLNTGKQGQQAFLQLAQAIATADTPVTRINAKLADLGVTLKNTVKWQISSSVLHGFMGAVQSAYGYAQDLNESLNNIRIVTGQNVDQMTKFAETANRAAKTLSTTTTDYTNASLIYYQQGLNDQQVKERTDITIKMANVARESAEVVSDQMTAVWNNFDNGSKSLEYYADVMTALGAATASSTDEIAAGLEKFAAVSETVGLSYEYATAALATVTDKTRQSADVVGTAFKTMFARIQGLKLGKTLEDGTDFNQYSKALLAVGVNIKDANGELKDMDSILNEMAAVWEKLNRDEQVALAQKVAGVRQYNQLMSLMENWDAMEINLEVAKNSEGALQEQADIYAESWEAAQDRVRAAAEGIYQNIIDDEFFITLLNGFEKVIETIDGVIQGLGGMRGVITLVGSLFLTQFAQKMPEALSNLRQNFMVFTGQSKKVMSEMQNELNLTITAQKADPGLSESYKIQLEGIQKINTMKQKLVAASKSLTSQEQEEYKIKIQNVEAMYQEAAALAEKKKAAEELEKKTQKTAETTANQKTNDIFKEYNDSEAEVSNLMDKATTPSKSAEETAIYAIKIEEARKKAVELEMSIEKIGKAAELSGEEIQALMGVGTAEQQAAAQDKVAKKVKETSDAFKNQIKQRSNLEEMSNAIVSQGKAWEKVAQEVKKVEPDKVKNLSSTIDITKQKMAAYLQIIQKIADDNGLKLNAEDIEELANKIKTLDSSNIEEITQDFSTFANKVSGQAQNAIGGLDASIDQLRGTMSDLQFDSTEITEMEHAAEGAASAAQDLENSMDNIGGVADENIEGTFKMSVALTEFASVAMSVSSLISSLKGVINTFTDEGASGFEKFGALLSTIMPLMSTFNALQAFATTLSKNATIAKWAETKATAAATTAKWAENAAWLASPITWIVGAILGVVAALGLLVVGISAVTKALNVENNALKEAEQREKQAADAAKRVSEEINGIGESLDKISSKTDALKELEEGTLEWYQALNEVNSEVQSLIDKYPELLSMGAITIDNSGLLGISEEGTAYINQKNIEKQTTANNIVLRAQQNTIATKTNNQLDDFSFLNGFNIIESEAKALIASYQAYGNAMFDNAEFMKATLNNMEEASGYSFGQISDEELFEWLEKNKNLIIEQARNLEQINNIDKQIIMSRMSILGSSRDLEETIELMGDFEGSSISGAGNNKTLNYSQNGEQKSFNMNQNIDYDKNNLPQEIKDFMSLQGENVEYEKQAWGELVLKVDGEEMRFSQDDVYAALKEMYDNDAFKDSLKTNLETALSESLDGVKLAEDISLDNLVALDNLKDGFGDTFENLFPQASAEELKTKVNDTFESIVQVYGTTEEALSQLKTDTEYVNLTGPDFQDQVAQLESGVINVNKFKEAIKELNAVGKIESMDSFFGDAAEKMGLGKEQAAAMKNYAKHLTQVAKESQKLSDSLASDADSAADLAVEITRMNKGIDTLADNFKDWNDILKKSDKTSEEYAQAMTGMKTAVADVLDVEADLLSNDFITSHSEDIQKAATGDADAIDRLRASMDEEIIGKIKLDRPDLTNLDTLDAEVKSKLDAALANLEVPDIEVGAILNDADFIAAANNLIEQSGMTADEANAYFAGIGYEPMYNTEEIDNSAEVPNSLTKTSVTSINWEPATVDLGLFGSTTIKLPSVTTRTESIPEKPSSAEGSMALTSFSGDGKPPKIRGMRKKATGSNNNYSSSNRGGKSPGKSGGGGGGGGSKPKPAQPTKKSDIVDRYKEQDDQLDDLKRTMDNAEKSLEKLYGDDKTKAIEKLIAAEREYKDVLKEKRAEARDALKEDRKALNAAASKVSVEFEYDAEGNLINYTQQMEALYNRLRAVEKAAGPEWTESEQEQIDALKEKIEALKEAQEQYESTRELIEDISDELQDLAGKPAMPLIKSDYIDIYKEIIDALDDIDKRLERLSKRADDLMGSKRLKQFKQFEGTSEEKLALIDEELSKNKTDIGQNKTYLKRVSKVLDVDAPKYDKKGNIVNSDEVLNVLWNRVLKVQKRAKKDGKISKAEQEAIDARLAEIDMYTSARDKYSDAVEYRKDLNAEKKEITDKVTVLPVVTNDFLDIYKEADDILDDIEHKASKIADESERATGKDKVAKLKELAKTEKERYQYIKKAQEINTSDKAEKKAAMEKAASSLKIPIKFAYDGNGNITNYNEIKQYYEQQYAAAYAEAMKDGFINADERDWLEQFKSDGETIEEYIQKYSEAVDQGEDLEEQAREAKQAAEDYILESLSYTVELNIEADERDLKLIEYQLSQLEDQGYATAEAMDLIDKKYTSLMNQSTSYTKGIDSIFKKYIEEGKLTQKAVDAFWNGDASGINWSIFSEAEIDKINEYSDGIMTVSESLMELRKTMDEAVISAFEEWTADMKEQLSLFDHYESIINSYNNITDLVGQERLGISDEDRKKYNDLRIDNATNRLASSKTYFDETKEKITKAEIEKAAAEARLAAAQSSGDESLIKAAEKDVKMWEDTLKVMYQENRDAEQQYLADWEAALQASRDAFLAETEMELEAFEKKMAGVYGSFDNMQKEFNRQSEKNDRYLQDYEKLYQLSKLNRDLSNKIDDTTNLKAKKELAKLQEEILEYQKDGVKMSDYDLKFLQKRYDLKLAEIALEEAQNAKTQVRLTRDSEGNYSYTYTADEDSIAKAQQSYEDKLYEISNLSNEYIEQQTSKLLSTQQAFVNELAEIHKKAAEGQYATTEEYQQALDDCSAYYTEQLAYYGDEIDKAANNNSTVYENDYLNYEGWMLEKIRKTEEDADAYIAGASNKSAAEAGFITSVRDLLPELEQAHIDATGYVSAMTTEIGSAEEGTGLLGASRQSYEDYGLKIDDVMVAAGSSAETFKDKMSEYLLTGEDSVANSSDEARQKIEEMALAVTDLDKTIANVSAWQTSYSGEIQKAIDKTAEFIGQINDMNQSLADKAEEEAQKPTPKPDPVTPTLENPVTNVGKEKKCPKCKQPLSKCKCGKNPPKANPSKEEKKCPKCGKKPCQCKKIAQKKAEEEARRKAEEKAKKKKKLKADARAIVIGVNNGTIKQTDAGWRPSAEKAGYSKKAIQLALDAFNQSPSYNYPTALDYIKAYNTGGYTGSWGAEGKLAMLHEKELVLNKEDTENMLKMVSMVRDIVSVLDIKAYQASLAQLAANQLNPVTNSQNAFEQTVTIHAEFPDAIYANEIETALNNLVNSASQFANRKY